MLKFAIFTDDGLPTAFYSEDVHGGRGELGSLIPVNAVEITDEQWGEFISNSGRRKWLDGNVTFYDPPPAPPVIPDRLSRRQFRLQLIDAGLLDQVEVWIAAQGIRTRAAYADSGSFLRSDEMLRAGFEALSFTAAQIDEFFINAAQL